MLSPMAYRNGVGWHLANYHSVEHKANFSPGAKRLQFTQIEEHVFRYELSILLDEHKSRLATYTEGDYLIQNEDYICEMIAQRLASNHAWYVDNEQIKCYLKNVSRIMQAALEAGQEVSALPFTNKSYQKKRGRPRKARKDEKAIVHNGKHYKSIAEAAKEDKDRSYAALRQALWRDARKESSV